MLENSLYIIVGVASGVLTALFVSVAGELWTSTVLPLCRQWRYRGADISGEWKGLGAVPSPGSGQWSEVVLTLKQNARDVRGTLVLRDRSAGHSIDLNLQVEGTTSNGFVTLTLWPASRGTNSAAAALLTIDAGSASLNGQLLYVGARGTLEAINVSVQRAASIAAPRLVPSTAGNVAGEEFQAVLKG